MSHFALEQWADFVRQVGPQEQQAAIEQHLDRGCEPCSSVLRLWRQVFEAASRERFYEAPESAVRVAKSQYGLYHPETAPSGKSSIARLLLDSLRQPLWQGVRGPASSPRHLLFGSGFFHVDMRIESSTAPDRVSLVGQVLNSARPDQPLQDIPVRVLKRKEKVTETATNEFGEFHLEFNLQDELRLVLLVENKKNIIVPLPADSLRMGRPDSQNPASHPLH